MAFETAKLDIFRFHPECQACVPRRNLSSGCALKPLTQSLVARRSRQAQDRPIVVGTSCRVRPYNAVESCDMGAQPQGAARQVVVCSHTTRHCGLSHREEPHLRRIPSSSGTSTPRASRDSGNKLLSGALTRCRLGRQSCSPPSIIGILPRSPRDASEAFGVSLGLSTRCR